MPVSEVERRACRCRSAWRCSLGCVVHEGFRRETFLRRRQGIRLLRGLFFVIGVRVGGLRREGGWRHRIGCGGVEVVVVVACRNVVGRMMRLAGVVVVGDLRGVARLGGVGDWKGVGGKRYGCALLCRRRRRLLLMRRDRAGRGVARCIDIVRHLFRSCCHFFPFYCLRTAEWKHYPDGLRLLPENLAHLASMDRARRDCRREQLRLLQD